MQHKGLPGRFCRFQRRIHAVRIFIPDLFIILLGHFMEQEQIRHCLIIADNEYVFCTAALDRFFLFLLLPGKQHHNDRRYDQKKQRQGNCKCFKSFAPHLVMYRESKYFSEIPKHSGHLLLKCHFHDL